MILKWCVVVVLLMGDVPLHRQLFLFDPEEVKTEADCQKLVAELIENVKKERPGVTVKAKCVDIEHKAADKAKPNDKKSEVTS